jgi:hypothetical protein
MLEEFKSLRDEIGMRGSEGRAMERYVVLADAALYSVLVFPKPEQYGGDQVLHNLAWFLPPIIGFLALFRWRESIMMIGDLAAFLRVQQKEIHGGEKGWEWFVRNETRKGQSVAHFALTYIAFWWVVIAGTAALAWLHYMGSSCAGIISAGVVFLGISLSIFLWIRSWGWGHN